MCSNLGIPVTQARGAQEGLGATSGATWSSDQSLPDEKHSQLHCCGYQLSETDIPLRSHSSRKCQKHFLADAALDIFTPFTSFHLCNNTKKHRLGYPYVIDVQSEAQRGYII